VTVDPPDAEARAQFWREIHASHPRFREALVADAVIAARHRGERCELRSRLDVFLTIVRLAFATDAFLAQALYRAKARLQALGVPILPRIAHRLAIQLAQISIGDPVVVQAGVYILHGQVVIDGLVRVGAGAVVGPFVTVGLRTGDFVGPVIAEDVRIGTGAKIIGPIRVGAGANIGANAVVVEDVPAGATVIGVPARPL
jgi:serine O-acetyltransferase